MSSIDLKTLIALMAASAAITGIIVTLVSSWLAAPTSDFSVSVADVLQKAGPSGSNSTTIEIKGQSAIGRSYDGGDVLLSVSLDNASMQRFLSPYITQDIGHPSFQSQLHVIVANDTPNGDYYFTITAKESGGKVHSCGYVLRVQQWWSIYAQLGSVTPDKTSYNYYDTINITGEVRLPPNLYLWVLANDHNSSLWWKLPIKPDYNPNQTHKGTFNVSFSKFFEKSWTVAAVAVNRTVNERYLNSELSEALTLQSGEFQLLDSMLITQNRQNGEFV